MKRNILLFVMFIIGVGNMLAQPRTVSDGAVFTADMPFAIEQDAFEVTINMMDAESRNKLNEVAEMYRQDSRSVLGDIGRAMLTGSATALVTVISEEIFNLAKLRSKQKKEWEAMRNSECLFVDSMASVKGQRDFYAAPSAYGPLDPENMRFDGITYSAKRNGVEVLRMSCSIDTTRLDHMFLHSKFYLVLDTLVFYPYRSYLPNLSANHIGMLPSKKKSRKETELEEYIQTIGHFSYEENGEPTINISMELSSSWINEQVQVYQDVKLGSFSINVAIPKEKLADGEKYVYIRSEEIAKGNKPIDLMGDCFIVPRSYMPVAADNPSWGTGEYRIKVALTQRARYNPDGERAKNWRKDYEYLTKMQNNGQGKESYWRTIVSDKGGAIIKAAYTPLVNYGTTALTGWINQIGTATPTSSDAKGSNSATSAPNGTKPK